MATSGILPCHWPCCPLSPRQTATASAAWTQLLLFWPGKQVHLADNTEVWHDIVWNCIVLDFYYIVLFCTNIIEVILSEWRNTGAEPGTVFCSFNSSIFKSEYPNIPIWTSHYSNLNLEMMLFKIQPPWTWNGIRLHFAQQLFFGLAQKLRRNVSQNKMWNSRRAEIPVLCRHPSTLIELQGTITALGFPLGRGGDKQGWLRTATGWSES